MPSKKKREKQASLNSLEQVPIPEKELNNILPLLPLPVNKHVDIDAYVDVDKLKSAIAIQFRKELVKNSRTILSCLVCDHTNNGGGVCKICFKNDKQTLPIYSSTYNDTMKRRNIKKNDTTMINRTTQLTRPTNKTQDQGLTLRPSSAIDQFSKNAKTKKIPSWYNLPYNKTVLSNKTSHKKNSDLDEFLQYSFREKFRQLQLNN